MTFVYLVFVISDAFGWLYACRGLYQLKEYSLVVEGLSHCLRHEKTMKEAQHLLAFSLLHTKQNKAAAAAFFKSIKMGNETDWQPLVEVNIQSTQLPFALFAMHAIAMAAVESWLLCQRLLCRMHCTRQLACCWCMVISVQLLFSVAHVQTVGRCFCAALCMFVCAKQLCIENPKLKLLSGAQALTTAAALKTTFR